MNYQQLRFTCTKDQAHALSDWLSDHPDTLAVSLLDAEDQPIYEPELDRITLWEKVEVEALLAEDTAIEPLFIALTAEFGSLPPYHWQLLAERDWVSESQQQFPPQCFAERLWLYPAWLEVPDQHQPVLRLSPGLAFGTGTHPTTKLCLQWLAEHVKPGHRVLDYGCGSGILALAALVLGAQEAIGVDLDPQALEASQANASLNEMEPKRFPVCLPEAFIKKDCSAFDVIVANILASPLCTLAPSFAKWLKPGGSLVLSGILQEQVPMVIDAYQAYIPLKLHAVEDDWCVLVS